MFRAPRQHAPMKLLLVLALTAATPARDHERARDAQARGDFVALETLLADAEKRVPGGRVLDVELEDGDEYEIELLRPDGRVVELDYDAHTGRFIELEVEDRD